MMKAGVSGAHRRFAQLEVTIRDFKLAALSNRRRAEGGHKM